MTLIELFTEYIRNKKSLKKYVEERKNFNTRGEFNDQTLIRAEDYLQRLKREDPHTYALMYETLEQYYKEDRGHFVEYPINFVRQILQIYDNDIPAQKVYEIYKEGLTHHYCDA
jgi:predicted KAP-like P-loop ATPase